MKRVLLLIIFILAIYSVASANSFQQSMSGKVNAVTSDTITVAYKVYKFTPKTTFRAHVKKGRFIIEVQIKKYDIMPGQNVVVTAQASTALQVIVERWRQ